MSSDRERLWLADIVDNVDRTTDHVGTIDFAAFARDAKTIDAVERCLQRISEAVIRIGEARMAEIAPSLPVHAVRGLGNALRHDYDRIDLRTIFTTVTDSLPALRSDCDADLARRGRSVMRTLSVAARLGAPSGGEGDADVREVVANLAQRDAAADFVAHGAARYD